MSTTMSGQALGEFFLADGYVKDSNGAPIEKGTFYAYECIRYTELKGLWKAADPRPRKLSPPIKKDK